ncbi:MAG TPA: hypothetical protein HA283_06015 [Nanoarchaeota archaeon]|nr:hypothetical protein [Nanoarchaeota archaeon]HIH63826.1 hypothetical protein [Nanoarchaeota archaeon]HIJ09109.1 hypothetical protein [Nanoarchaeota archaeon]
MTKTIDELWGELFDIKNKVCKNVISEKDAENSFQILAGDIIKEAKQSKIKKDYFQLSDIFYHCEEALLYNYGSSHKEIFPIFSKEFFR